MIDCQQIERCLQDLARSDVRSLMLNFYLHGFAHLASTNRTAWDLLSLGTGEGTVAIAEQQTSGRGQWGRQWQSDKGGVYLSLILCPSLSSQEAPQLTIAAGWGIAQSLRTQGIPVQLKWPNDLILAGRKLGGILTETRVTHQQIDRAVVGVGLNGFNPVPPMGINLQAYLATIPDEKPCDLGILLGQGNCRLEAIAAIVLHGLNLGYSRLMQEGITPLIRDYEALLIHLGQDVTLHGQLGRILGVTTQGNLSVQFDQGVQEIRPGTLQLGYPAALY